MEDQAAADEGVNVAVPYAPTTTEHLQDAARHALQAIDDVTREGLRDTPRRWAKMMLEMTSGHDFEMTTFPNEPKMDEMIVEVGIPFYSMCEHHLVPFFGHATVGYIPSHRIVGISKLCRTVDKFSRRLQVQERMTQEIADMLQERLEPKGVAVLVRARHLCQEMRGIKKSNVETVTSCMKGAFMSNQMAREEFMAIAREAGQ